MARAEDMERQGERLARIEEQLKALVALVERSEEGAKESRSRLYKQVESLGDKQAEIRTEQDNQAHRLTKIETTIEDDVRPVIARIEALEQRAHGAAWLGKRIRWAAHGVLWPLGGALIAFWEDVLAFFSRAP